MNKKYRKKFFTANILNYQTPNTYRKKDLNSNLQNEKKTQKYADWLNIFKNQLQELKRWVSD